MSAWTEAIKLATEEARAAKKKRLEDLTATKELLAKANCSRFRRGERVKIKDGTSTLTGKLGTIVSISGSPLWDWLVEVDGGRTMPYAFREDELELLPPEPEVVEVQDAGRPEFGITGMPMKASSLLSGAQVAMTSDHEPHWHKGQRGLVLFQFEDGPEYAVHLDNTRKLYRIHRMDMRQVAQFPSGSGR